MLGRNLHLEPKKADELVEAAPKLPSKPSEQLGDDDIPFPEISGSDAHTAPPVLSEPVPTRPRSQSHRRRSIRDLAYQFDSALELERSLLSINGNRLLNTFFTINTLQQEDPVYISELSQDVANPHFNDFDLSNLPSRADRNATQCVVTIWGKTAASDDNVSFQRIVCEFVDFTKLKFIGRTQYCIYSNFPQNSLIFALTDGYYLLPATYAITAPYSNPTDDPSSLKNDVLYMGLHKHSKTLSISDSFYESSPQYTLSFNSIMKLSNLQECIVDAENTKSDAAKHISTLLAKKPVLFALRKERQQLQYKLQVTRQKLTDEKARVAALRAKVDAQKAAMNARREYISRQLAKRRIARRESTAMESTISSDKVVIRDDRMLAQSQRARIANDLNDIFPINLIPDQSFKFSICDVPLPDYSNSQPLGPQISRAIVKDFGVSEDDLIAAAYGFAAQVLTLLSYYLGVPLRYPVQPYGSQSFIIDPISAIQGSRTFPLWTKGSFYFRFQYASFLFNKNIEQLMCSQAMVVADLKPTLANLKNILLVLSTESRKEYI